MTRTSLVTGGAGFIGGHIVDALAARGDRVIILDNLDPRVHPSRHPVILEGVVFIRGSVTDKDDLDAALAYGVDHVYHEAAMVGLGRGAVEAEDYVVTNVLGTVRLMHAMARARHRPERLILASTMAVYGEGAYRCDGCDSARAGTRRPEDLDQGIWDPVCPTCHGALVPVSATEEQPFRPGTVYATTKLDQELTAMAVGRELGIPVVALRYHNVYGPRMPRRTPYAGVASFFKSRLMDGNPPIVHEDGTQLRDFVHVRDIARANLMAADAPLEQHGAAGPEASRGEIGMNRRGVAYEAFNIGTGTPRPIMDVAKGLADVLDPDLQPKLSGTYRPGDARHVFASTAKAERILGFAPEVTFEDGIREFAHAAARDPPDAEGSS